MKKIVATSAIFALLFLTTLSVHAEGDIPIGTRCQTNCLVAPEPAQVPETTKIPKSGLFDFIIKFLF